ncbi:BspA family leucine-rich repeat surface protein [Xylocopilactobacillus apicola]|uniref:Mub B2-like domain-containing protein n=1 Tax=Xylocopilactobacillus apicola TaxID=2932184 RepID=A0AAU9D6X8_9LACO|nr:BspA family leucine-rich repeat surface protein [Xylocopilactobacillus apicola]BDR59619.1 hypothetical protein XA3_20600 [Xylocopilactobacillus apicola]
MSLKNTFGIGLLGLTCPLVLMSQQVKADNVAPATEAISSEAKPQDLNRISIGNFKVTTLKSGTWGTSNWEYVQDGNDYVLKIHAGTLPEGSIKDIDSSIYMAGLSRIEFDTDVVAAENSSNLFSGLSGLREIVGLDNLDTTNVDNMSGMFNGCYSLTDMDLSDFNTTNVTDMSKMFYGCGSLVDIDVSNFDTSNVTSMVSMFENCGNASIIDVSNFNTSKVRDMYGMFSGCASLSSIDVTGFNTARVRGMSKMFYRCALLSSIDVSSFNTAKVSSMYAMFSGCSTLENLSLKNFKTSRVTELSEMFSGCVYLSDLDLSSFNTINVTSMNGMFSRCSSLTKLNLSNFNTVNVINMNQMFYGCNSLSSLDLSSFKTFKVRDMDYMFSSCTSLTSLDLRNFDTSNAVKKGTFSGTWKLNHLVLGPRTDLGYPGSLPTPPKGTKIPGTNKVVTSQNWVATSGYSQGSKYSSVQLANLTGRDQVTTYDWDTEIDNSEITNNIEYKTITRTINLHQPDYTVKADKQAVKIQRIVTNNADGTTTYGPWSTSQWDQYNVPVLPGYEATQTSIPAQAIDESTSDIAVDIYYDVVQRFVAVQYFNGDQMIEEQKYMGFIDDVIIPRYHAPRGYDIIGTPPATITIDGTNNQVIKVNVKPHAE